MKIIDLKFSTSHGVVRRLTPQDAAAVAAITDESVTSAVDFLPADFGVEQALLLLEQQGEKDGYFGLFSTSDQELIAVLGVHVQAPLQVEIGYWFAQSSRGQGIATDAVRALVRQISALCPGCAIVAECAPANVKSWALLRRIGFAPLGRDGKRTGRRLLRYFADAGARIDVC